MSEYDNAAESPTAPDPSSRYEARARAGGDGKERLRREAMAEAAADLYPMESLEDGPRCYDQIRRLIVSGVIPGVSGNAALSAVRFFMESVNDVISLKNVRLLEARIAELEARNAELEAQHKSPAFRTVRQ